MKKEKCNIPSGIFSPCKLPEIDIKERRQKVKLYLKYFNKAINEAIKDDDLLLRIKCEEEMNINFMIEKICKHSIDFEDKNYLKL